jgi:NhaA family Na+:H+ antiporter
MIATLSKFAKSEAAGGSLLMIAAATALAISNSPLAPWYAKFLELPMEIRLGDLRLAKPLLLWINDGLMAVFFFLVGLEIKRAFLEGELASASGAMLPVAAALGGMLVPALIYFLINRGDAVAIRGWAIPSATDIAFALGVLALLGSRVPASLAVFLAAVAVLDDLGAIVVIAVFYTENLSIAMLGIAAAGVAALAGLNAAGVRATAAYVLAGAVLWVCVLKSGVHATLAGVITALFVPLRGRGGTAPFEALEHGLAPWVAFGILPVFAFANAGVSLAGISLSSLLDGVPLGIAAGLLIGKLAGVLGASALVVVLRVSALPQGVNWRHMVGTALLCGIGFTMSLFIGALAFEGADPGYMMRVRVGVLSASIAAAVSGYAMLRWGAGSGR